MSYILSCCSPADLSREHFEARDLKFVCFHYQLDGKDYPDDLGRSIPFNDFYRMMQEGADTRTSQVNVEEYIQHFEPYLKAGQDILHVTLSGGISGSVNAARQAAVQLKEAYPERELIIVDSLAASSGYGLLMDLLADQRDAGLSLHELADWAEANKLRVHHWFFSTDLTFFIKGGRVSKTAGFFGQMLNICPLLNVDCMGRLIPRDKIRTKRRVIREIVRRMEEHAEGGAAYAGKCYISQSACYEDARAVADLVEEIFPAMKGKVEINSIGNLIGSHTGPGTVALFFVGDPRVD